MSVLKTTPSVRSRNDWGFFTSSSSLASTSLCCSTESSHAGGLVKNGSEKGSLASTSMSFCESCRCAPQPETQTNPASSSALTRRDFVTRFHIFPPPLGSAQSLPSTSRQASRVRTGARACVSQTYHTLG